MCTTRQQVLIETHAARQHAEGMLKALLAAQAECDAQLANDKRVDLIRTVTGRSSLETAIENTRRMIDALDRAVEEARDLDIEPVQAAEAVAAVPATDDGSRISITVRPASVPAVPTSGRYRFG